MRTIDVADLAAIQDHGIDHARPTSRWHHRCDLRVGHVARVYGRWAAIQYARDHRDATTVQLLVANGGQVVLQIRDGLDVRTDVQVDTGGVARAYVDLEHVPAPHGQVFAAGPDVPLTALTVGTLVHRYTTPAAGGRLTSDTPCCGRVVTLLATPELPVMTVCCRHRLLYAVTVKAEERDGWSDDLSYVATWTVVSDYLAVAVHRGGRTL